MYRSTFQLVASPLVNSKYVKDAVCVDLATQESVWAGEGYIPPFLAININPLKTEFLNKFI
jgi:hypothetical protein